MSKLSAIGEVSTLATQQLEVLLWDFYVIQNPEKAQGWFNIEPDSYVVRQELLSPGWHSTQERILISPDETFISKSGIIRHVFTNIGLAVTRTKIDPLERTEYLYGLAKERLDQPIYNEQMKGPIDAYDILPGQTVINGMFNDWVDHKYNRSRPLEQWLETNQSQYGPEIVEELRLRCQQPYNDVSLNN